MSLYLYQSNRLEVLFKALCRIHATPLNDPLVPEIIVVQNPGMARWLSQHIALQTGIAANIEFPLPATFIWEIFKKTLGQPPDLAPFERDVLLWRILDELVGLQADPSMEEIAAYLQDDEDGSRKFQLAGKITDLFDQYLVYRPEMLLDWQQEKDNHWQAVLWRRLTTDTSMHRAALLQQFSEADTAGNLRTDTLPQRICFFGINSLAPAYLDVIARISRLTDIHIFHLSPCCQAWDDILPQRLLAIKRHSWRNQGLDDISDYFTSGNPLLASMGGLGREFFSLLMEMDPVEIDLYEPPEPVSLLTMIQDDILELRDRSQEGPVPFDPDDASIRFHCCHSPMREIQVLHDRLLDIFTDDPTLKPADILIMAPDINLYAPLVSGVFGSAPQELRIPWSIADQSRRSRQPVIDAFLGLLELASSRFTAPDVMALLENQAVLNRFGLPAEDFSSLRAKIEAAGIRWGLDREQRLQQGMDDSNLHTWEFGLERLLLGHITGPLDIPFQDIMPCGGTLGDSGPWLGSLAEYIRMLQRLQRQLKKKNTPAAWSRILLQMVEDFFDDGNSRSDQEGLLMLRETIGNFADCCTKAGFGNLIGLSIVRDYFSAQLAEPAGGQAFLSGRVTFCNMVPMRSVPFKIIWLLGMNDMDYPRSQRPPAFDLIARKPRLGDRSRRDDDRYLFLEALLSTRSRLSISWVGRDQQENTQLPPSVVVAELRDYIDRAWQPGPQPETQQETKETTTSDLLTVEYPLQPFSRRCFNGNPKTAAYAKVWLPASTPPGGDTFFNTPLPTLEQNMNQVDVMDLVRFWNHPVRFFLQQRLGLRLARQDDLLPESEAFCLDHLQKYQLCREIVTTLLAEEDAAPLFHRLQAAGALPRGEFGRILYQEMLETAAALARELTPLTQVPVSPCEVDIRLPDISIKGWLTSLFSTGRVSYRPTKLKAQDLLQLWIHHLILQMVQPEHVAQHSTHVATDTIISFGPVHDPEAELAPLISFYQQGLAEPLHFYPGTSYAWAKAKTTTAAANSARKTWYSGYYRGEEEDPAYSIALRGQDPLDTRFEQLTDLFAPILAHKETLCEVA